ncbi:MAG: hypothetical protein HOH33_10270 [Verrucomicrobia bacterium]|jgi:hypothetical protein|nr:hypothetical protein [Verrucomicrobiota bacterium]
MKTSQIIQIVTLLAVIVITQPTSKAQGRGPGAMHADMRDTIHELFDGHDKFHREVKQTEDGYTSITTSKDPDAAKLLQKHVKQMENRLKQGMMVRRWDPAYEEFVRYYDDIDIKIKNIANGISITATGKTKEAREVARNHAGIVSKFVKHGWTEHDKSHPTVESNVQSAKTDSPKACCLKEATTETTKACCLKTPTTKT